MYAKSAELVHTKSLARLIHTQNDYCNPCACVRVNVRGGLSIAAICAVLYHATRLSIQPILLGFHGCSRLKHIQTGVKILYLAVNASELNSEDRVMDTPKIKFSANKILAEWISIIHLIIFEITTVSFDWLG